MTVTESPARAFERFTERLGDWWPPEFSWSGEVLEEMGMEPWEQGMLFEVGPHGFRCDWGRITTWSPPKRLVFTWQIGPNREPVPDPAMASEVEVRFDDADGGTHVSVEHRAFERHGERAETYRDGLSGAWAQILDRFARAPAR